MVLNGAGGIVREELLKTPIIRQNIFLDAWVIMPNHLHVIIEIINPIIPSVETPRWDVSETINVNAPQLTERILSIEKTEIPLTKNPEMPEITINLSPSIDPKTPQRWRNVSRYISPTGGKCGGHNPKWKPNSLGSTINQFKSACTKKIWKSRPITFAWQSKFYDHIIRNDKALNKIREYIIKNPERWERDRNLPDDGWGILENSGL
jgi:REP element-mobilizing transposase RayT